ncbi:sugar kinase [Nocardiopsis sediminis]|uniref:Sugar kinase n=1 Tax=Nocardiopsis sediminis TaxID=1778267 RepID=A0ABV8FLJ3_9ACTN
MHDVDLLAIGETMVMVTPRDGGRLTAGADYALSPGGAESNVAALMAQLGHSTAWASAVGDDPLGDIVVGSLRGHGVDVGLVRRDPHRPTAVYFKDPAPSGTSVHYYRSGSAASALGRDDLAEWRSRPAAVVHVSGITAALSEQCRDLLRHIVFDRPLGGLVSFDVNRRPALWGPDGGADELLALARRSDIVFVGRDEAEALWGTSDAESVRDLIDAPRYLVVKDADIEAVAFTPEGTVRAASRRVDVVDPVGAGDAFAAGWLSGLVDDRPESMRLRMGHYVASRVLMSPSDFAELPPAGRVAEIVETGPQPGADDDRARDPRSDLPCHRP